MAALRSAQHDDDIKPLGICLADNCGLIVKAKGLCNNHYRRSRLYGDSDGVPEKACLECSRRFAVKSASQVTCSEECRLARARRKTAEAKARSGQKLKLRTAAVAEKIARIEVCPECRCEHRTHFKTKKFCSRDCFQRATGGLVHAAGNR